jgi:hypothetical protein
VSAWSRLAAVVLAVGVAGCGPAQHPPAVGASLADRPNEELAAYLPVLADYPGMPWEVAVTVGAPDHSFGPYIDPSSTVEPAGCADIPFQRKGQIAAAVEGNVPNGVAGDSGEASVRLLRDRPGSDLIAESQGWAKRCREYRQSWPRSGDREPGGSAPTVVSLLPPISLNGVELTRIHLTDNREHRFQPEGSRESVVLLARARGLVLVGFRHDSGHDVEDLLGVTLTRLANGKPASKPLSGKADGSYLNTRTDRELRSLLPSTLDLPSGWTVQQSSPMAGERAGEDDSVVDCGRIPFDRQGRRADTDRDFHEVATVTAAPRSGQPTVSDLVRLGIDTPGTSVIDETTRWAKECTSSAHAGERGYEAELLPTTQLGDAEVTNVRYTDDAAHSGDTASLLEVRGILVITKPALNSGPSPLAGKVVDNLRHASFDTPAPPGYHGPHDRPFGDVKLPPPSAEADRRLAPVAQGTLVNSEQYHFGGYLPGDGKTRSPDYVHFRSPTGSILCTWRKDALYCEIPHGTYPRMPKPADAQGDWADGIAVFGWNGIQNGVAETDPTVYAESNVLPYGHTIRLEGSPYAVECLSERDGLTCVNYETRAGVHLSRGDLTPLMATDALAKDTRPEPQR